MAYDQALAARVRAALRGRTDIMEKEMFGGVAFLVAGKMACGIIGRDLMVRVGPPAWQAALAEPHARPMDFTGKPMNGYVYVAPGGLQADHALGAWIARGVAFVETLNVDAPRRPREGVSVDGSKPAEQTASKKKVAA